MYNKSKFSIIHLRKYLKEKIEIEEIRIENKKGGLQFIVKKY